SLMRVEHHLTQARPAPRIGKDERIYFPSRAVPEHGVMVTVSFGHTWHAMAPLLYVNKTSGEEKVVFGEREYWFKQLSFEEHGHYLLVGTEYSSEYARVVDMRTGHIVRKFPQDSFYAVWVPTFQK
ncbi:MAG: hypothetical protein V3U28_07500, partial [Candidatus Acidoferrales bacterium]